MFICTPQVQRLMELLAILYAYFPFISLLLLLLISYYLHSQRNNKQALILPPGPTKLPIIGNLHQLGSTHPHQSFFKLSQKHGPLMYLKLGSVPAVVVSSAETAKEFLKIHDLDCCTRAYFTATARLSYNRHDVGFNPYGPLWRELRKICIIEFFSSKKVKLFESIRREEVGRMIESIISCTSQSDVINLSSLLFSLSNDITCRAAVGRRYYSGGDTDEKNPLHKMLEESQAVLGGLFFADYLPALGWLDVLTGMRSKLEKNFRELDEFYQKMIEEHMDERRSHVGGEDTMDALLRIQKEATHLTKEHIKGILMNIFIGGSDTSSAAVEWTMTELMRHPDIMKKAQDEVRNLVGKKGRIEESDLHQLSYMKCVVKEVFRLHPPAPLLIPRSTMRHFKINGFDIPAKTRVLVSPYAIGREERSWKNPEEFKPERFINSTVAVQGHDFQLIPFGAGRRTCPGMHVGMAIIELALANLLHCFDWELPKGVTKEDIDMDEAVGVTMHRKSALHLVATKYSGIVD